MHYVRIAAEGVFIVRLLEQQLTAANAAAFRDRVRALVESGERRLILEMSRVKRLDSSGIGALLGVLKMLGSRGDLVLVGLRGQPAQAMSLSRMDRIFTVLQDEGSAMAMLKTNDLQFAA